LETNMKKWMIFTLDVIILFLFLVIGITGLLIYPGLLQLFGFNIASFPKYYIYEVHHWFGLVMLVLASIHIDMHWKWIKTMTKRVLKRQPLKAKKTKRSLINYGVDIGLMISFLIVFITGIIKFRGFTSWTQINPRILPLYQISILHDNAGILALLFSTIHLFLHRKWLLKTAKSLHQQLQPAMMKHKTVIVGVLSFILILSGVLAIGIPLTSSGVTNEVDGDHSITIEGIGTFTYPSDAITPVRDDIFTDTSFSLYAILVYLDEQGEINVESHFDETMNTYVIDAINGREHWWYEAYYDGGWPETNVLRMDHYPFKQKTTLKLFQTTEEHLQSIYSVFQEEIQRKKTYETTLVIPRVVIEIPSETLEFSNIEVTPHNKRNDLFEEGVITALDVIMSLADQGELTYELNWYDSIGSAEIVRNYFVDSINGDTAFMRCGYVYEEGSYKYQGFTGNHIHIPADARALNAPEYVYWFWICI